MVYLSKKIIACLIVENSEDTYDFSDLRNRKPKVFSDDELDKRICVLKFVIDLFKSNCDIPKLSFYKLLAQKVNDHFNSFSINSKDLENYVRWAKKSQKFTEIWRSLTGPKLVTPWKPNIKGDMVTTSVNDLRFPVNIHGSQYDDFIEWTTSVWVDNDYILLWTNNMSFSTPVATIPSSRFVDDIKNSYQLIVNYWLQQNVFCVDSQKLTDVENVFNQLTDLGTLNDRYNMVINTINSLQNYSESNRHERISYYAELRNRLTTSLEAINRNGYDSLIKEMNQFNFEACRESVTQFKVMNFNQVLNQFNELKKEAGLLVDQFYSLLVGTFNLTPDDAIKCIEALTEHVTYKINDDGQTKFECDLSKPLRIGKLADSIIHTSFPKVCNYPELFTVSKKPSYYFNYIINIGAKGSSSYSATASKRLKRDESGSHWVAASVIWKSLEMDGPFSAFDVYYVDSFGRKDMYNIEHIKNDLKKVFGSNFTFHLPLTKKQQYDSYSCGRWATLNAQVLDRYLSGL